MNVSPPVRIGTGSDKHLRLAGATRAFAGIVDAAIGRVVGGFTVPIARHRNIAGDPKRKGDVPHAGRIGIAKEERSGPKDSYGIDRIAIPIANQRPVTKVAKLSCDVDSS